MPLQHATSAMLANVPPFILSADQIAKLDSVSSTDAKTMYLQVFHQEHCWAHRQVIGVFASLDPATFSREWAAREAEFMGAAWAAYLGAVDAASVREAA